MGELANREPGVLLSASFDPDSKTLQKELDAVETKLKALQQKHNLAGFITATKREGKKLLVKVLPMGQAPAGAPKPAADGWGPGPSKSATAVSTQIKKELGWGAKKK